MRKTIIRRSNLMIALTLCGLLAIADTPIAQSPGRPAITPANAPDVTLLAATGVETIFDLDWSPDGEALAVASSHNLAIYAPDNLRARRVLSVRPCSPAALSPCRAAVDFSDDGAFLIAGVRDVGVEIYHGQTFAPLARYRSDVSLTGVHFIQPHALLALAGGPNNVNMAVIRDFDPNPAPVTDGGPPSNPPSDPASASASASLSFYERFEQRGAEIFERHASSVQLSPDGRYLAAALSTAWLPARPDYIEEAGVALYDLAALFAELDTSDLNYNGYDFDIAPFRRNLPMGTAAQAGPTQVRFNPDGARLAGAGLNGHIHVWSMPDGALELAWGAHYAPAWDIDYSPDGARLASAGGDGALRIWDAATGEALSVISDLGVAATAVAYSPDGSRLAVGGWDGTLWMFDATTGALLGTRPTRHFVGWAIAYNTDGTRFALASESGAVYLYDTLTEPPFIVERQVLHGLQGAAYSLAFHPDGEYLAAAGPDGIIHVWAIETGEIAQTHATAPRSPVYGLAYNPLDGALHCATLLGAGRVAPDDASAPCTLAPDSQGAVYSLAFSPDGTLLAQGDTHISQQLSGESVRLDTRRGSSDGFVSPRSKLTFSAEGRTLLNGGPQQPGYLWRMSALSAAPQQYDNGVMALSPDGALVAGGWGLAIYDTVSGAQLHPTEPGPPSGFDIHSADLPRDAVFSPDGRLIVVLNSGGALRFWGLPAE